MDSIHVFTCPVCQEALREETKEMRCTFCGTREEGDWCCPNQHYTCETCRVATPAELIERVCRVTAFTDPVALANLIMCFPAFNAHGPEHHLMIAPILLTVLANSTALPIDKNRLPAVIQRTADIPIGVCSSRGDCGACVGVGAAFAVLGGLLPKKGDTRSLTLRATAQTLLFLSQMGGHRCCKQSVYASLETAAQILNDLWNLPMPPFPVNIQCAFSQRISDCKKERCPYYEKESRKKEVGREKKPG